jgi:hypothetical protein
MSRFQPGQSGNPGGRPKAEAKVKALAQQHTEAAINALVESLADPKARVAAATALLDRAWGKPAQAIAGADGEGPAEVIMRIVTGVPRADGDD